MKFAPLHIHSGYSFLQSGLTVDKICKTVLKKDYFGAAICDKNVLFGWPLFIKNMEANNKPYLLGVELKIHGYDMIFYVIEETGYKTLCLLSSFIDEEDKVVNLLKENPYGLVGILSTSDDDIRAKLSEFNHTTALEIKALSHLCEFFYVGLDTPNESYIEINNKIKENVINFTYQTIAFPLCEYAKADDAIVLKIADAISKDTQIEVQSLSGENYFKDESLLNELYSEEDLKRTITLFDKNKFNFHKKRGEMLSFGVSNSYETLKNTCFEELSKMGLDTPEYNDRLNHELKIISDLGYCDYFLIVADYVNFANTHGILTGPGRGSAAGSLVSFLMHITKIDPLKYDLLFERFLNPSRKKMPDIDIDFMDTRRDEVILYLKEKYGIDKVSNIVTFSTILAKQSLRDIGRIYNKPTRDIDLLSSRLKNYNFDLHDSYRKIKGFRDLVDSDKYYLNIVALASKIENLPRQSGLHAAGVILNNSPLEKALPVIKDFQGNYITQYEMNYLEDQGFLKMDLLGLRNLTIISNCVDLINARHPEVKLDKQNVPFDTKEVYDLIRSNKTVGLFQLESAGMKHSISLLKPTCFNDIVALLALFRPGPMDSIPTYARRKEGKEKVTYISDALKDILKDTYGIIVYQEQIIQITQKMAGFTLAEADTFRQAISKKKVEEMEKMRVGFISGSIKNGYSENVAINVYNLILKFAHYGFNKSHSVGYSMIACQMAYLKANYPLEFYAAILKNSSANDVKFSEYVAEMKERGLKVYLPRVNSSTLNFTIVDDGLLLPFTCIKGIQNQLSVSIIEEREENGPYTDFLNFVTRLHHAKLNPSQLTKLVHAGCFDEFNISHNSLIHYIPSALEYSEIAINKDGQILFDLGVEKPILREFNDDPMENLDNEYETIGIMLSANPLTYKKDLIKEKEAVSIKEALTLRSARVVGIIRSVKVIMTKKGSEMAFVKLFDDIAEMEITFFSDAYQNAIDLLKKNTMVIVDVKENIYNQTRSYIANKIELLED